MEFQKSAMVCLAFLTLLSLSCAPAGTDSQGSAETTFVTQHLQQKLDFEMCWANPAPTTARARDRVKAVVQEWYAKTPVKFSGFGPCPPTGGGFRIFEYDDARWSPKVAAVGTAGNGGSVLNGVHWHLILNHTFEKWSGDCRRSQAAYDNCVTAIGLHEVGHLVGMRHSQAHPDSSCGFEENLMGASVRGPYDPQSIMNYCNGGTFSYASNTRRLSAGDLGGLWLVYGALFREGAAAVTEPGGTALKKTPASTSSEERCTLREGSSWRFRFLGVENNHVKVRLLTPEVVETCRRLGQDVFLYPMHFRFWR